MKSLLFVLIACLTTSFTQAETAVRFEGKGYSFSVTMAAKPDKNLIVNLKFHINGQNEPNFLLNYHHLKIIDSLLNPIKGSKKIDSKIFRIDQGDLILNAFSDRNSFRVPNKLKANLANTINKMLLLRVQTENFLNEDRVND